MKKNLLLVSLFIVQAVAISAQVDTVATLTKKTYMIPMRDGVKLNTVVFTPTNYNKPVPILIERTPYSANFSVADNATVPVDKWPGYYRSMLKEGYILVFQDIRGKFGSEGT